MEEEIKMGPDEKIIYHFTNIKNFCDSAITLVTSRNREVPEGLPEVFGLTEKIQEEIEEVRDLLFG
jgi:hypothetical protein